MRKINNAPVGNQSEIKGSLKKTSSLLGELNNDLIFNRGNDNCEHEWHREVRPCSWDDNYDLVELMVCSKCKKEKIVPGSSTVVKSGAECLLDEDGFILGYL